VSSEEFLKAGYAVIFLTRRGSLQPFTTDLPEAEALHVLRSVIDTSEPGAPRLNTQAAAALAPVLETYAAVAEQLLVVPYITIFEYLQYLKLIATACKDRGPRAMFYLAAAVSDFFIPWGSMVEHKIQSGDGPLHLELQKVPKLLGQLRHVWAPGSFVVSFKLETDESILVKKAAKALRDYRVHAVVANLLHTRKDRVLIVRSKPPGGPDSIHGAGDASTAEEQQAVEVSEVLRPGEEPHIEGRLVAKVILLHRSFQNTSVT